MKVTMKIFKAIIIISVFLLFGCGSGNEHKEELEESGISDVDDPIKIENSDIAQSEVIRSGVVRLSVPRKVLQNHPSSTLIMNLQGEDWGVEDTTSISENIISKGWQYQEHLLPGDYRVRIALMDTSDEEVCGSSWVDFSVEASVEIALEINLVCSPPQDTGQVDIDVNFIEYPEFRKIQFSGSLIEDNGECKILSRDAGIKVDYIQSNDLQLNAMIDGEPWDITIGEFNPLGLSPGSHTLLLELNNTKDSGINTIT